MSVRRPHWLSGGDVFNDRVSFTEDSSVLFTVSECVHFLITLINYKCTGQSLSSFLHIAEDRDDCDRSWNTSSDTWASGQ